MFVFSCWTTKRGGEINLWTTKKKKTIFSINKKRWIKPHEPLSSRGGGAGGTLTLMVRPIKNTLFLCVSPLTLNVVIFRGIMQTGVPQVSCKITVKKEFQIKHGIAERTYSDWLLKKNRVSPISTSLFCCITWTPKFHNVSPFWWRIHKIYRKYAKRGHILKFKI